jgi:beta-glucanase (GH16 family)
MFRLKSGFGGCAAFAILLFLALNVVSGSGAQGPRKVEPAGKHQFLVWSDEFNGPDGSLPDPAKWNVVNSGSGFGNNELEYYTNRPVNIHQEKGNLVITVRKETYAGTDGLSRAYTSARIETRGLFHQKYGRIEARIKLPAGQGIWPAFWMLGNNFALVKWPTCGEIDIMEHVGYEPSVVHGSLHGEGYSGEHPLTGMFTLPNQARFSEDFHLFAVEWEPREIRFYVDDILYETQTVDSIPSNRRWAFDHPFFLLLNVAVGGDWAGPPDTTTSFPVSMVVDYVRVYRLGDDDGER